MNCVIGFDRKKIWGGAYKKIPPTAKKIPLLLIKIVGALFYKKIFKNGLKKGGTLFKGN